MFGNRMLILLGGCLLMASAALADDLGFVDCSTHPDETQVFAKARKSQDVVATMPCGERFKVVLYGFIFSEIQTADGKVGFVYSSILTIDRGGTLQVRAAAPDATPKLSAAAETTKIPADPKPAPAPAVPAAAKRAAVAPAGLPTPPTTTASAADAASASNLTAQPSAAPAAVAAQPDAAASPSNAAPAAGTEAASAGPAIPVPAAVTPAPAATDGGTADPAANAAAPAQPAVATPDVTPAPAAPPAATESASNDAPAAAADAVPAPAAPTPAAEPPAAPAPRPEPAPVEPGVQNQKIRTESWETPNPGGKNASLLEFFGGFAYSRMSAGSGVSDNFLGGLGSFGFNVKPWLQISGDSSYSYYNVSGTKYVLYGNHYGPRIFWRRHNRFGVTPFGEALFGGSRQQVNWPAANGYSAYTTSANGFSWKVGGGIDMRASHMFEIRLIDVDYYRTSFGSGMSQTNYWVSTGIVLRLFRGWSE